MTDVQPVTWRFEIWTHPRLGPTTFVAALPHAGASLYDRRDAVVDSYVMVPGTRRDLIFEALKIDPITRSSSRSRIIRAFRVDNTPDPTPTVPDHEFVAADLTWKLGSEGQLLAKISGPDLRGSTDDARVLAFDYPQHPTTARDWMWDGPNIFDNGELDQISNEIQSFWIDGITSTDTYTVTFDGQTTPSLTWGADPDTRRANLLAALEALSNITEVDIIGEGTALDPFEITFLDPGEQDLPTIVVTPSAGTATVNIEATGGFASIEGWTKSYNPVTGEEYGSYTSFRVTNPSLGETGLDGSQAALVWVSPAGDASLFSGWQVILGVTPGSLLQISARAQSSNTTQRYRLVVRDLIGDTESRIASTPDFTFAAAGVTQDIGLNDVKIPRHVDRILIRLALTSVPATAVQTITDSLVVQEGLQGTTAGGIIERLLQDLKFDHAPRTRLTWLDTAGDLAVNDSSGTPWAMPSVPYAARQGHQIGTHVLDGLGALGHIWDVEPTSLTAWQLKMWDEANHGADLTADPGIAFLIGQIAGGKFQMRLPAETTITAVGADGVWTETSDPDLVTAFGDIDGYLESDDWLDTAATTAAATERLAQTVTSLLSVGSTTSDLNGPVPWKDVNVGDQANFALGENLVAKHARTISQLVVTIDEAGRWTTEWTGSKIFEGASSTQEALRRLLTAWPRRSTERNRNSPIPPPTEQPSGTIPWVVAASNAPASWKAIAGFICTGTDDQVEIQACLDTYQLAHLSPGSFTTDTGDSTTPAITIPTGATLQGSGYQETFLENLGGGSQPVNQTTAIKAGLYSTLKDIYVGNTNWDGGIAVATGYGCLIDRVWAEVWQDLGATALQGSAGDDLVTLRDCRLVARNSGSRATAADESYGLRINATGLDRWTIDNCDIEGGTYAVKIDAADTAFNFQIANSRIGFATGWDAIWLNGDRAGYFGSILGCHFRSYGQSAATADLAAAIRITGTGIGTISDSDTADTPLTISDCSAEGSGINGIVVIGRAGGRIVDCYFEGLTIGVLLDDASEWRILDSDFFWCGTPAGGVDTPMIRLTNATSRARVMGCTLRTEQGNTAVHPDYGIEVVTADCTDNRILHNDLEQPTGEEFVVAPILDNGTGTIFAIPTDPTWGDNLV